MAVPGGLGALAPVAEGVLGALLAAIAEGILDALAPLATGVLGATLAAPPADGFPLADSFLTWWPLAGRLVMPNAVSLRLVVPSPIAPGRLSDRSIPRRGLVRPARIPAGLSHIAFRFSRRAARERRDRRPASPAAGGTSELLLREELRCLAAGRHGRLGDRAEHLVPPDEDTDDKQ